MTKIEKLFIANIGRHIDTPLPFSWEVNCYDYIRRLSVSTIVESLILCDLFPGIYTIKIFTYMQQKYTQEFIAAYGNNSNVY